jgi:hypothetical protein
MAVDERILEAIKDEPEEVNNEQVNNEQVNNEQINETVTEEKTETPAPAPEPVEPPVKTYTQDEYDRMVYSLKRQMGKQRDSLESKIADYNKRFTDFESRLNKLANPEKPLRRSDFETDDSYIEALINNGVEKRWAEREAKMREEYEKYEAERKAQEEQARELEEGIAKWYPDETKRKEWYDTVSRAYGEGLQELLEKEQNVMNYLYQTPNQSLILYKLATDPQAVQSVFSIKNPLMRLMAVRDMENELVRERNNPAPVQAPVQTPAPKVEQANPAPVNNLAKAVGKPGAQVEATPDAFDNTDSLRDLLRKL